MTLLDPDLFRSPNFTAGISGQMLQQVALGGAMIALPLFLQMTLEYNAMEAGLSLAPLSLTMFAAALLAGTEGRGPASGRDHPGRVHPCRRRDRASSSPSSRGSTAAGTSSSR